jgi:tRNA-intron endonuclease
MIEDILKSISAQMFRNKIIIKDVLAQNELESKGYGEREGEKYFLRDYEALYLLHSKKLDIIKGRKNLSFIELVRLILKNDKEAWTRFLIYRDLRSRGYVIKEGFGFGIDFRIYNRGEFGSKSASYIVFGLNEGTETTVEDVTTSIDQMTKMGKDPIVAVVERRGELIYYRISKTKFKKIEN